MAHRVRGLRGQLGVPVRASTAISMYAIPEWTCYIPVTYGAAEYARMESSGCDAVPDLVCGGHRDAWIVQCVSGGSLYSG